MLLFDFDAFANTLEENGWKIEQYANNSQSSKPDKVQTSQKLDTLYIDKGTNRYKILQNEIIS